MIIREFSDLYTIDSKGKIRIFKCLVKKDETGTCHILTETGILNGKLIIHRESINKGKQNRTVLEQAEFQADSLWTAKWDEGYKDYITLAHKTVANDTLTLEEFLKRAFYQNPEAAFTNADWYPLPMLAHKFKDVKTPKFPYYIQPKLNGVRCLVTLDHHTSLPVLISRGGQYYSIPHLENEFDILFDEVEELIRGTNLILDGEIYKHNTPLQEISGAARKDESGLFCSNSWLEYHIYDVINLNEPGETYKQRYTNLCALSFIKGLKHIKFVNTILVETKEEIKAKHDEFISEGYEGAILRDPYGEYRFNERSRSLLKVKEFQDEEFEIIGTAIDDNKSVAESFVFILKNNINDLTFKARPTGTNAMKEQWYKNSHKFIGAKATVRFFERSSDGIPTHGNLRHKESKLLLEHIRPQGE